MEGLEEVSHKLTEKLRGIDDRVAWDLLPLFKKIQGLTLAGFDVDLIISSVPKSEGFGRISLKDGQAD